MNPRSFTPLCRIPRSSSRAVACLNVACERANATWCTAPWSVEVRVGSGTLLVREDGDEAAVARVEVEVALGLVLEVRLLEHERHTEHSLPEVDRRLPIRADDGDVVHALALELPHSPQPTSCSRSLDLYSLRRKLPHGTSSTCV